MSDSTLASRRKVHRRIEIGLAVFVVLIGAGIFWLGAGARYKHVSHLVGEGSSAYRACHHELDESGDYDLVDIRMEHEAGAWTIFFDITRPAPKGGEPQRSTFFCRSDGEHTTTG